MAYQNVDYTDVIAEQLLERDKQLREKELPAINIGEAVPITEGLDFGVEEWEYGVTSVMGSVKNGVIGIKTTSLQTIDADISAKKAPVVQWAKGLTYTQQELEKWARLNINSASIKQNALYANALATIQYAGYLGHEEAKGQEGLLTGKGIPTYSEETGKTIKDMTSEEFVAMILTGYDKVWSRSNYTIQPTHIAMDASDFMAAMQKFDTNATVIGTDLLPIAAMDRVMAALRKASQNDSFSLNFVKVPSNYAKEIKAGKTRLAIYTHDDEYVEMKVHMPELIETEKHMLAYQSGYRSAFTGTMWREPNSAQYVDYKSTAKA